MADGGGGATAHTAACPLRNEWEAYRSTCSAPAHALFVRDDIGDRERP